MLRILIALCLALSFSSAAQAQYWSPYRNYTEARINSIERQLWARDAYQCPPQTEQTQVTDEVKESQRAIMETLAGIRDDYTAIYNADVNAPNEEQRIGNSALLALENRFAQLDQADNPTDTLINWGIPLVMGALGLGGYAAGAQQLAKQKLKQLEDDKGRDIATQVHAQLRERFPTREVAGFSQPPATQPGQPA